MDKESYSTNNTTLSLLFRFIPWLAGFVLGAGGCVSRKGPALLGFSPQNSPPAF